MNKVVLSGRLGNVNKTLYGEGEKVCCFFSVATTRWYDGVEYTDWISCKAWGKNAKLFSEFAEKGYWIEVLGYIKNEKYNDKESVFVIVETLNILKTVPKIELDPNMTDRKEI